MNLNRIAFFVGALMLLLQNSALAEPPAGMVLYFQTEGEVYILLAEHADSKRGWAAFGGGAREGETVAQTAAHKAQEETRGYFKSADLLKKIEGQTPLMDGDFASYFAEVSFVPAQRVMNNPVAADNEDRDAYLERSTFAWIPYSAVADHLQEDIDGKKKYTLDPAYLPAGSETQWLWPAWLGNMRKAVVTGTLPWGKK
ncbi:MAG: ADP-ribose pyrophosphatase YjhB (NUDIX family) [Candidatus Latescibacterota bacterium]|jgi:ADP-ribose pyrophosphatase YjhB (NUDIX family)